MTALCKRTERSGSGLRLSATFNYETEKTGYGSGEDHTRLSESLGGTGRAVEEKGLSGHWKHTCGLHGALKSI
ncbi:hypothetical protein [Bacteroides thetaiotaomicron]|uniref:hypothetical protein n=1 Tax=Bacteroides thetaiotaomicron TaxID=818 RepID=UPI0018A89EC0|nr:hypothetical protein [Bacteroides thetaiotaomicron]MDC2164115.1 hypothetical protein [Bacteroides thetaiotaomicron]